MITAQMKLKALTERSRKVNRILSRILDSSLGMDPGLFRRLKEAERLSRFSEECVPGDFDMEKRAEARAKKYGCPYVLLKSFDSEQYLLMPKRRLKEKPFGLGPENIVYETGKKR